MRIYEFSKEYSVPTKEILSALQEAGFGVKSHMSLLDEKAIMFLKKKFNKNADTSLMIEDGDVEQKVPVSQSTSKFNNSHKKIKSTPASARTFVPHKKPSVRTEKVAIEAKKSEPKKLVLADMSVAEFEQKTGVSVSDIILTLLRMGIVAPKNKVLPVDVIKSLAAHYSIETELAQSSKDKDRVGAALGGVELKERLPVVVVLGHVDHGKTTLLDFIRKTRVASREKGGITQHIGAYEAATEHGSIVFLDTPGHEAFSKIRQRGVRVADIVILIVAADDGVKPQTIEALKQALSMNVPIIVAVNKMDKVDPSRVEVVKRELSQYGLMPEEWGGTVVFVPISAKTGKGVSDLLEMVTLQAQLMELRAEWTGHARGYVLESNVEKGYGPVATIICQHGEIKIGDFFKAGSAVGKVTVLINSYGKKVASAGPSVPVRVAGFESLPEAGDYFECVSSDYYLANRGAKANTSQLTAHSGVKKEGALNLIIKTDTNSSKEALLESLAKLSHKADMGLNVLSAGVGGITEGDIELAYNTGSMIVGLHSKIESRAASLAQERGVVVHLYDIIYKLLEKFEELTKKAEAVKKVFTKVGEAYVLKVFDIKGVGVIAGSYVKEGRFAVGGRVTVLRRGKKVGEGTIKSLQREKKSVKEVHTGFECGFVVDGFNEWQPDDVVECLVELPAK